MPPGWRRDELLLEAHETVRGYELIYQSMKTEGLLSQQELEARRSRGYKPLQFDEISVLVARDGELQVCQGGHRFAIAQALGIGTVPVWIAGRHSEWSTFRRRITDMCLANGGQAPEPLLHPDLANVPADPAPRDAFERVRGLLSPRGVIVDVTPGWGYTAQRCESMELECVAVARDAEQREVIERLRVASCRAFAVEQIDVDQKLEGRAVQAVLALGDVAGLLRSEQWRHRIRALLRACRPAALFVAGASEDVALLAEAAALDGISPVTGPGPTIHRLS